MAYNEVVLMLPSLVIIAVLSGLQTGQADERPAASPKKITMVAAEGCVDGRSLKMGRPAGIEDADLIVSPIYRLTESTQIKGEIKALDRRPVRVRGQLSELPGSGPPSTMIGDTRVTIGTGPDDPLAPTVTRAPEPPAIEMHTITALDGTCNASHAPSAVNQPSPIASSPSKAEGTVAANGHYMYAWVGDADRKGNDFLAVIDADPASASYGRFITTVATDQKTMNAHHTEYSMPASGMLFANDHDAGRTFVFDVRDPLRPKVATSFTDMGGYMHPHSYLRLPNGNVLASFQHAHQTPSGQQA
jgi:hypothetical protein